MRVSLVSEPSMWSLGETVVRGGRRRRDPREVSRFADGHDAGPQPVRLIAVRALVHPLQAPLGHDLRVPPEKTSRLLHLPPVTVKVILCPLTS